MKAGVWICEQVWLIAWCTVLPHSDPPHMLLLVQAWPMSVCTWTPSRPCHIRPLTTEQSLCIHSWTWQFVLHADNRVIPLKWSLFKSLLSWDPQSTLCSWMLWPWSLIRPYLLPSWFQVSHSKVFFSSLEHNQPLPTLRPWYLLFSPSGVLCPTFHRELIPSHSSHLSSIRLPQESFL